LSVELQQNPTEADGTDERALWGARHPIMKRCGWQGHTAAALPRRLRSLHTRQVKVLGKKAYTVQYRIQQCTPRATRIHRFETRL